MSKQNKQKQLRYGEEIYLFTILYIFANPKTGVLVVEATDLVNYVNMPIEILFDYLSNLMKWNYIDVETINPDDIRIQLFNFTVHRRKILTPEVNRTNSQLN